MEIGLISFEVTTDKQRTPWIDIENGDLASGAMAYTQVFVGIYGRETHLDESQSQLGVVNGLFFDMEVMGQLGLEPLVLLGEVSPTAAEGLRSLDLNSVADMKRCFVIEQFFLEAKYRGQGVGSRVLELLEGVLGYCLHYSIDCWLVQPLPFESERQVSLGDADKNVLVDKLEQFYRRAGFVPTPRGRYLTKQESFAKIKSK